MKIITTAVILVITLLIIPIFSYFFGTMPGLLEWKAITTLAIIMLFIIAFTFLIGEMTHNNSQVDKLWSILPIIYVWVIAAYGDFSPRLVLMSTLVTIWGSV